jgi:hypothetical protein
MAVLEVFQRRPQAAPRNTELMLQISRLRFRHHHRIVHNETPALDCHQIHKDFSFIAQRREFGGKGYFPAVRVVADVVLDNLLDRLFSQSRFLRDQILERHIRFLRTNTRIHDSPRGRLVSSARGINPRTADLPKVCFEPLSPAGGPR